ncbi:MAG: DUF4286 family protein [Taibaiella sp.]|nr:DUF4286 family protein [Taibaiella sp.]
MIIYNVTIKVNNEAAEEWIAWMKEEHLADVLSTGLFNDARLSRLLEQPEDEGSTFVAQYFCDDISSYNRYIDEYADGMRAKGLKAFGSKFVAFRTVMEVI